MLVHIMKIGKRYLPQVIHIQQGTLTGFAQQPHNNSDFPPVETVCSSTACLSCPSIDDSSANVFFKRVVISLASLMSQAKKYLWTYWRVLIKVWSTPCVKSSRCAGLSVHWEQRSNEFDISGSMHVKQIKRGSIRRNPQPSHVIPLWISSQHKCENEREG